MDKRNKHYQVWDKYGTNSHRYPAGNLPILRRYAETPTQKIFKGSSACHDLLYSQKPVVFSNNQDRRLHYD